MKTNDSTSTCCWHLNAKMILLLKLEKKVNTFQMEENVSTKFHLLFESRKLHVWNCRFEIVGLKLDVWNRMTQIVCLKLDDSNCMIETVWFKLCDSNCMTEAVWLCIWLGTCIMHNYKSNDVWNNKHQLKNNKEFLY